MSLALPPPVKPYHIPDAAWGYVRSVCSSLSTHVGWVGGACVHVAVVWCGGHRTCDVNHVDMLCTMLPRS